jgi:Tol biopolymer transport system component
VFAEDDQRLSLFAREARLLASLNHPHIATLYGLEDADGMRALVLELVEGPTLADRIAKGPLPTEEALRLARQIAEALEAAHEKGIVHRDLKPANVKLTRDGHVKVLDFGLATAFAQAGSEAGPSEVPRITTTVLGPGTLIGTPAYMSPEQARGLALDKRTDIWAFGCVTYEMLARRPAFGRQSVADTVSAVLGGEVDWARLPNTVPANVRRLLQRCLERDPRRRLRDIGDARLEIEEAAAAGSTSAASAGATAPPGRSRPWAWTAALLLAAAAAWAIGSSGARTASPAAVENPLANARFTRLTDFDGAELDAAISPDGRFVAFLSDRDGRFDVWLSQVGSGVFRNLTNGSDRELPAPVRTSGFSSDGSQIWLGGGPGRRLQLMTLMGGTPRAFLSDRVVNVSWSPDGSRLAYHTRDAGDPVFVADRDGSNARQVLIGASAGEHNHFPVWSRDGRWIFVVRGRPATSEMDVWRVPADGGMPERLTQHASDVGYPTPLDDRTILYVAGDDNGAGPWLWALDMERRRSRRVVLGLERYTSVSASADGSRLIATVANPTANLWTVPILDRIADERDARLHAVPTINATTPQFAGEALFYTALGSGGTSVWQYRDGEAVEIRRGLDEPMLEAPAVSRDGTRVALALRRNGKVRMHVLSADGAELSPLSDAIDVRGSSAWSPDRSWIVTGGSDAAGDGLFKMPVEGGAPVRLITGPALDPVWSPEGNLIVYAGANVGSQAPLLAVRPDGTPVTLPAIHVRREGGGSRSKFLPDGRALIYTQGFATSQDFWMLDLATGKSRQLTRLDDRGAMWSFDVSLDGRQIVFDRSRNNSDLVLIDLPSAEAR